MLAPVCAPDSRYVPPVPVDLSSSDEQVRLSPGALRAFFNIAEAWGIPQEAGMALLGGVSSKTYYKDRLTRISYLVGIFKALNILYSENLANAWPTRQNSNRIFKGQSPVAYMIVGGLPAMQVVRRLLDARRGGV